MFVDQRLPLRRKRRVAGSRTKEPREEKGRCIPEKLRLPEREGFEVKGFGRGAAGRPKSLGGPHV